MHQWEWGAVLDTKCELVITQPKGWILLRLSPHIDQQTEKETT